MSLEEYVSHPDRRVALEAAVGALIARTCARFLRKRLGPGHPELAAAARGLYTNAATMLATADWSASAFPAERLTEIQHEHEHISIELQERYRTHTLPFPGAWAVEEGTSLLLYALVRALRPANVLEVGVGNGASSYYLLRALEKNGQGILHSFDIEREAGGLLSQRERREWDFRQVNRRRSARSLAQQLSSLPPAHICFHDGGHKYLAQSFDFAQLWANLREGGVLVSDDVDASYALIDFCRRSGTRPDVLIDRRKSVGVVTRGLALPHGGSP